MVRNLCNKCWWTTKTTGSENLLSVVLYLACNRYFFYLFDWDSLHARLNSHYEACIYKRLICTFTPLQLSFFLVKKVEVRGFNDAKYFVITSRKFYKKFTNVPSSQNINFIAIFQFLWLWKAVYRNRDNDYNLFQKLFEKWDVCKVSSHVERNWFLQITLELLEGILTANFKNSDAGKLFETFCVPK